MSDLYDQDFVGWTEQQARLLREVAAQGTNLPLDWEHLIEEVEALGRSEKRALASEVRRLLLHLLKLEHSPARDPRAGWSETVANARAEIAGQLRDDPGLRARLQTIIREESLVAVTLAEAALRAYGEDAAAQAVRERTHPLYAEGQLFGTWLPERPDI